MQERLIVLIILVAALIGIGIFYSKFHNQSQSSLSQTTVQAPVDFSTFGTFKNGYEIKIPTNWINTSDSSGHAIIQPGKNGAQVGSLTQIVISTNSESSDNMSTQEDFDSWYAKKKQEISKDVIQKLDNTTLDGEKAVELIDTSVNQKNKNAWSIVTWTRKDGENYYIDSIGNQRITTQDFKVYDFMLRSFKFSSQGK